MNTIPNSILQTPIVGVNLRVATLRQQLGDAPTALVFLRHFG